MLRVSLDAAFVNLLHRLIIALAATLLVLAFLRKMLTPKAAWFVAAWWAVMPINFDSFNEVHLFALLPILAAWIVGASGESHWHRGWAAAILLLDAILVRNEMLLAFAVFLLVCLARQTPKSRQPKAIAYLLPIALALAISGVFYSRSYARGGALGGEFHLKHAINMGQVYAFGYHQRHPQSVKRPFLEYSELSEREFGTAMPTLSTMLRRNPKACLVHVLWNLRLLPAGLQLMMFSATSSRVDADYPGQYLGRLYPIPLSILVLSIIVAGAWLFQRDRAFWAPMIRRRQTAWIAMLSVAVSCAAAIVTQRPRPAYVFALTLLFMTVTGFCAVIVLSRFAFAGRTSKWAPLVMIGLPLFVGSAYRKHPRPMYDDFARLKPYTALLNRPEAAFLGARPMEVNSYLGHGRTPCFGYSIFDQMPAGMSLPEFLEARHVTILELDFQEISLKSAGNLDAIGDFVSTAAKHRWGLLELRGAGAHRWMLFVRADNDKSKAAQAVISPAKLPAPVP
jgi:hypothetical protein